MDTRRGAEEYERQLRSRLLNGEPLDGRKEEPTFEAFSAEWLKTYPKAAGNRPTSEVDKEIAMRVHLVPAFGRLGLSEITPQRIDRFTADKLASGLKSKSVHNHLTVLSTCLKSAVDWEVLEVLPKIRKPRIVLPEFDWFREDEIVLLLKAARDHEDYTRILFSLDTGTRAGEVLGLEWGDIEWATKRVVIRRSRTRGEVGPPKSGKHRHVPMTDRLHAALSRHRHLRSKLVFCREDGSPLKLDQLHESLERTCRKAGLREIRWHDLRHTFASRLAASGVSLPQIKDWLGHSTIDMVLRYAHLCPHANDHLIHALEVRSGHQVGTGTTPATANA